jgi:hypothetical protein
VLGTSLVVLAPFCDKEGMVNLVRYNVCFSCKFTLLVEGNFDTMHAYLSVLAENELICAKGCTIQ